MRAFLALSLLSLSLSTYASSSCKKLAECISETSSLTGIKFIYPDEMISRKEVLNTEMALTKENAQNILSEALGFFGFIKVPTKLENVWKIIPARDVRYEGDLPAYSGSKDKLPTIADSQDFIQFTYQAAPKTEVGSIARNLRPMLSRYGRVLDLRGGTLVLIDRISNIKRMFAIITAQDFPPTNEEIRALAEDKKHMREVEILSLKHPPKDGHRHELEPRVKLAPAKNP